MSEKKEGISRIFETPERIKEADTEYLKKRGVRRVGYREVFSLKETKTHVELCGGSAMRYYYDDKTEEPQSIPLCLNFPKDFLPQFKAVIEKIIEQK